jgi:hypothetical protein
MILKRLPSGFVLIQGSGPCEWAQVPHWPCDDTILDSGTFPEASARFREQLRALRDGDKGEGERR